MPGWSVTHTEMNKAIQQHLLQKKCTVPLSTELQVCTGVTNKALKLHCLMCIVQLCTSCVSCIVYTVYIVYTVNIVYTVYIEYIVYSVYIVCIVYCVLSCWFKKKSCSELQVCTESTHKVPLQSSDMYIVYCLILYIVQLSDSVYCILSNMYCIYRALLCTVPL